MSEQLVLSKLDELRKDVHKIATSVALNNQSYSNLNAELQEHKKDGKWRANRNIAIVAIMFTALGCWVGIKGLRSDKYITPTAIVKEVSLSEGDNTKR